MPTLRTFVTTAALLLPLPAMAAPPSFDCAKAAAPVEKAICASATLSGLDVAVAAAYGRALKALPPARVEALKKNQRLFLTVRDEAFASDPGSLEERLREQAHFLEAVDPGPRSGVAGIWGNVLGRAEIGLASSSRAVVHLSSAEPISGRWVCDVAGKAKAAGGHWRLAADEGWTVTLGESGGLMTVVTTAPRGHDGPTAPPFCGFNGTVDGDYLPLLR